MNNDNIGFFIFIKLYIEKLIIDFGDNGLEAVSYVVMPAVSTMVLIWLMFEGFRILNGQAREPITALLWRTGKVVAIVAVAGWIMSNPGSIRSWINNNIKDNITQVIAGDDYGSPEAMVDSSLLLMHLLMGVFGNLQSSIGASNEGSFSTFVMASAAGQGTPAVVAGALLLLNQIAISLCILTAPAFILCLIYEPTKQYFQGWLKFFLSTLFTLAVLSVMVTIALKVVLVYNMSIYTKYMVSNLFSDVGGGVAQTTIMQGGLGLLMSALMIMAPSLAGQLFGSTLGFSPYSPWGNAGARDASGAPVGNNQVRERTDSVLDEKNNTLNNKPSHQALMPNQTVAQNTNVVKPAGTSRHGAASNPS